MRRAKQRIAATFLTREPNLLQKGGAFEQNLNRTRSTCCLLLSTIMIEVLRHGCLHNERRKLTTPCCFTHVVNATNKDVVSGRPSEDSGGYSCCHLQRSVAYAASQRPLRNASLNHSHGIKGCQTLEHSLREAGDLVEVQVPVHDEGKRRNAAEETYAMTPAENHGLP